MTDPDHHVTVDGAPPMEPLPERRIGGGARVTYRFPERAPAAWPPPPLEVRIDRRERPPVRLGGGPRRTLAAMAEACAPSGDLGFDPGEQAVRFMEGYIPYLPPPMAALLPLAFRMLEWLPLVVGPRRGRLSRLPVEARRVFLERLEAGPGTIGEAAHGLLGLVKLAVYDHPVMHEALRYDPQPFIDKKVVERRERFGAPEPW